MSNSARHRGRRKHRSKQKAKEIEVHRNKEHSRFPQYQEKEEKKDKEGGAAK